MEKKEEADIPIITVEENPENWEEPIEEILKRGRSIFNRQRWGSGEEREISFLGGRV